MASSNTNHELCYPLLNGLNAGVRSNSILEHNIPVQNKLLTQLTPPSRDTVENNSPDCASSKNSTVRFRAAS
jgi:hypothetical protein